MSLLIQGLVRICINIISNGEDIMKIYNNQCKIYKLNESEKSEFFFALYEGVIKTHE